MKLSTYGIIHKNRKEVYYMSGFPENRYEALTMLYLQNQDLSDKTPTEIHELYWETYREIAKDLEEKQSKGYFDLD